MVFNKPSGIAVQGGSKINLSLDDALKHLKFKEVESPKLVHRIDKNTSGILLVARNIEYAQYLTKLFRYRKVHKKIFTICKWLFESKKWNHRFSNNH